MPPKILLAFWLLSAVAFAQTAVTGTVVDPNGNPYAGGTASATSVPATGRASFSTTPVPTDSNGLFTLPLTPNSYIFTICAPPTQLGPSANPTPKQVCFQSLPIAISGPTQDISGFLNGNAAVLGPAFSSKSGASFVSAVGFQAIPPSLPNVVWAQDPSGVCAYNPVILNAGQVQVCNSGNGSLWLNTGTGNTLLFATKLPSANSLINGAVPQWVTANNDFEIGPLNASNTLPAAQTGDCIRFNSAGDSLWDAVNCAAIEINAIYAVSGGTPVGFGTTCTGNVGFATGTGNTNVFATATRRPGVTYFITPAASTSTVEGMTCGQNGNNSLFPIVAWYRYSTLFALGTTTTARFWMGVATWNNGSGTGTNSTAILNTVKFATDTPNSNTIAFRFSSTTDTTFKAVACVAAGACTVADTGVTADTSPHLFEMAMNSAGTSVNYFIDSALKATISTNLPTVLNSADGQADIFWTADNKNTVSSPNATFYSMQFSLK
jgi:hypothetical protein